MLFYDLQDRICLKLDNSRYKILYDGDFFIIGEDYYTYRNDCFYSVWECDGDMEVEYENKIHPRKMNIVEMEDLFDLKQNCSVVVE